MRISDWSSDVCSSDLRRSWAGSASSPARATGLPGATPIEGRHEPFQERGCAPAGAREDVASGGRRAVRGGAAARLRLVECAEESHHPCAAGSALGQHAQVVGRAARECVCLLVLHLAAGAARSEEHTSELQSLMRTSYAVFCLKTKNLQ